jgi:hypothetical protein
MTLLDLGKEITKYGAPLLGSVIGGPAGAIIGSIVANIFGGDIGNPSDLITKIHQDTESVNKLHELELAHQVALQQLVIQQAADGMRYSNDNTADARRSNLASKTLFPQFLSTVVIVGFFACIYWVAVYKEQGVDHDVMFTLLGAVGSGFGIVLNYWLGSSAEKGK